jgi:hypothetical protein
MQPLHYFPPDAPVSELRKTYCEQAGYRLLPYNPEEEAQVKDVLLHVPFVTQTGVYMSPENAWKTYFSKQLPEVRIIQVTSLGPETAPNIWRWYHPPHDVSAFLASCLSVGRWEPVETYGIRPEQQWKLFWDGHDKNGFGYHFGNAKTGIQMAFDRLSEGDREFEPVLQYLKDDAIAQKLETCRQRWFHYAPYWKSLPFLHKFEELEAYIQKLFLILPECNNLETLRKHLLFLKEDIETADEKMEQIALYLK